MAKDETVESEYLGDMYAKHGGEMGWSAFGSGAFGSGAQPDELAAVLEEGMQDVDHVRVELLGVILGLALEDFQRMPLVERVGSRMIGIAAAVGFLNDGHAMPLPGARRVLGDPEHAETVRTILIFLLNGANTLDAESVGKQILSVSSFLNRAELEGWSMSAVGRGSNETPAGTMERIRRMCNRPIEKSGGRGTATWQQTEKQRAASSEAQKKSHAMRKQAKKTAGKKRAKRKQAKPKK